MYTSFLLVNNMNRRTFNKNLLTAIPAAILTKNIFASEISEIDGLPWIIGKMDFEEIDSEGLHVFHGAVFKSGDYSQLLQLKNYDPVISPLYLSKFTENTELSLRLEYKSTVFDGKLGKILQLYVQGTLLFARIAVPDFISETVKKGFVLPEINYKLGNCELTGLSICRTSKDFNFVK